jgi:hypothetical protein
MSDENETPDGDTGILVWFHRDAADALDALARRTRLVGDLVKALGPGNCATAIRELQRLTRITCELAHLQFAHLNERTDP